MFVSAFFENSLAVVLAWMSAGLGFGVGSYHFPEYPGNIPSLVEALLFSLWAPLAVAIGSLFAGTGGFLFNLCNLVLFYFIVRSERWRTKWVWSLLLFGSAILQYRYFIRHALHFDWL